MALTSNKKPTKLHLVAQDSGAARSADLTPSQKAAHARANRLFVGAQGAAAGQAPPRAEEQAYRNFIMERTVDSVVEANKVRKAKANPPWKRWFQRLFGWVLIGPADLAIVLQKKKLEGKSEFIQGHNHGIEYACAALRKVEGK